MGQFTQKPEDPSNWAGLPSEPTRPLTEAELLGSATPADVALSDLLGGTPGVVEISIPVAPASEDEDDSDEDVTRDDT